MDGNCVQIPIHHATVKSIPSTLEPLSIDIPATIVYDPELIGFYRTHRQKTLIEIGSVLLMNRLSEPVGAFLLFATLA